MTTTATTLLNSEDRTHLVEVEGGYSLHLGLNPKPASRPRVGRWGTYYSKTYKQWMEDAAKLIPVPPVPLEGPLSVNVLVQVEKPRTSKLDHPKPDIDNYIKAILDALTKAQYWQDDHQVIQLWARKEFVNYAGACLVDIRPL